MKFLNYKSNIETFSISIRDVQASCPVNIFPFSFEEKWRGYNINQFRGYERSYVNWESNKIIGRKK